VSVEKSNVWGSRLMLSVKRNRQRSLAATGEESWWNVGRWNARTASRVGENISELYVTNSLATYNIGEVYWIAVG
jgi:N-acetylmuramoyl-L-alanine amidase